MPPSFGEAWWSTEPQLRSWDHHGTPTTALSGCREGVALDLSRLAAVNCRRPFDEFRKAVSMSSESDTIYCSKERKYLSANEFDVDGDIHVGIVPDGEKAPTRSHTRDGLPVSFKATRPDSLSRWTCTNVELDPVVGLPSPWG